MHADEHYSGGSETAGAQLTPPPPRRAVPDSGPDEPGVRSARFSWWSAAAWTGLVVALFAIFLRISNSFPMDSDAANNALQAWDMLHGNVLLHGWIIGDATYYTFELPIFMVAESIFGLHVIVAHAESALVYVIVTICAMLVARIGSRGLPAWIRSGVVLAIMAAPLLIAPGVSIAVEKPDHTGTAAITLLCFLLIDRASGRRFMPVLLCAILTLGQFGDATVLYVAVPAIAVVCLYQIIFRRRLGLVDRLKLPDTLTLVAAGLSIPLAKLAFAGLQHLGGYSMIAPQSGLAGSWSQVGHNLALTGRALRIVFGAYLQPCTPGTACGSAFHMPGAPLGYLGLVLGWLFLAAALFGFGKVIATWHRAGRADQLLCAAIVANIAAYTFSTIPVSSNSRELIGVVPCGAILAARALVPERIQGAIRGRVLAAVAAVAVVLPLAGAASVPTGVGTEVALAAWLESHGLKHGISGYWEASSVTLQSGGEVQVRAVKTSRFGIVGYPWETKTSWYNPSLNYANFVIAHLSGLGPVTNTNIPPSVFEKYFGPPAATYLVANRVVLVYHRNLLNRVTPPTALTSTAPPAHKKRQHQ
jgi:hypothetical protein